MRWLLKCLKLLLIAGCVTAVYLWFLVCGIPWLQMKTLERQTKKNVNPTELRTWALDLIAKHPDKSWDDFHGPDFKIGVNLPAGIKKVDQFKDGLYVGSTSNHVALVGNHKGGPFLEVGPSTFAAPTNMSFHQWEPGIYFVSP